MQDFNLEYFTLGYQYFDKVKELNTSSYIDSWSVCAYLCVFVCLCLKPCLYVRLRHNEVCESGYT